MGQTDLPRLPDPSRSFAVLIGASRYRSAGLANLPAVRNNLRALALVLTDPMLGNLPAHRCIVLPDPSDVRTVYRVLRRYAAAAEDTLLVYFAGHGRTGPRNELYLGLSTTDPDELSVSGLPFELIREVFAESPASNRVLILDCCFAGRAIQDMSGPDAILGQLGIAGTYTLTSTAANAVALAPAGATYTAFTGELVKLIYGGVPGGPALLTLNEIYRQLRHTMRERGFPLPERRTVGMADQLALTRNPAHDTPPRAESANPDPMDRPDDMPATAGPPLRRPLAVPPPARRAPITLIWLLVAGLFAGVLWTGIGVVRGVIDAGRSSPDSSERLPTLTVPPQDPVTSPSSPKSKDGLPTSAVPPQDSEDPATSPSDPGNIDRLTEQAHGGDDLTLSVTRVVEQDRISQRATRVELTATNNTARDVKLPLDFDNCEFVDNDGHSLPLSNFYTGSEWTENIPAHGYRRSAVTFERTFPAMATPVTLSLAFQHVDGFALDSGDKITVAMQLRKR